VTNASGTLIARYDFAPFGEELGTLDGRSAPFAAINYPTPAPSDAVREKFTGQQRDSETGLDFMNARYFSAPQGRFTSADGAFMDQNKWDPQSWNLFSYVRNNPLRFFDGTGATCQNSINPDGTTTTTDDGDGRGRAALQQPATVVGQASNTPDPTPVSSPLGDLILGAAVGHHGLPEWSKIPRGTPAWDFFSKWFTGPLQDNRANMYDKLHQNLNAAARKIVADYLKQIGKSSLSELNKSEVKALAQRMLDSKLPGVTEFMARLEALNPGSIGVLQGLINGSVDLGAGFTFLVPGQLEMIQCGRPVCGTSEMN
jgi:RHS repeat-associated protein